jgi:hypothetical protein
LQKATDLTIEKEERDQKIARLVTNLENSVFLEKENDQLSTMMSKMNAKMKSVESNLSSSTSAAKKLAVENIKLKKILEGQKDYYKQVSSRQTERELALLEREKLWTRKERDMESMLDQKHMKLVSQNDLKHRKIAASTGDRHVEDMEDLASRLTEQFHARMTKSERSYERRYEETMQLHASEVERWNEERKRLEKNIRTEHNVSLVVFSFFILF